MGSMIQGDPAAVAPRRGRPRSAEVDEAVLAATLAVAGEVGLLKLSMDVLAERAKVSKATIYRRWPSKEQLVLEALRWGTNPLEEIDTGSLRSDLDEYLTQLARRFQQGQLSDVLPQLIAVARHDASLQASLDEYVQIRRRPLRLILERGRERGELSSDIDLDVLIDVVLGPIAYRRLLSHDAIDDDFVANLLKIVIPGLAPRPD
jgi:AcrR family transcriptional regulator